MGLVDVRGLMRFPNPPESMTAFNCSHQRWAGVGVIKYLLPICPAADPIPIQGAGEGVVDTGAAVVDRKADIGHRAVVVGTGAVVDTVGVRPLRLLPEALHPLWT